MDCSVPLTYMYHDPRDLGLICLIKKQNPFGFKNPILDFLKETHPKALSITGVNTNKRAHDQITAIKVMWLVCKSTHIKANQETAHRM